MSPTITICLKLHQGLFNCGCILKSTAAASRVPRYYNSLSFNSKMIIVAHFEQLSLSNCTFHLCEKHIWQATFISPCKVDTWYWHSGARTGHTDKRPGYIITIINCCPSPLTILYPCSRWLFTSNATWNEEDREIISQNIFLLLQKDNNNLHWKN